MKTYKKNIKFNRASKISRSSINPNITYENLSPIDTEYNYSQYINKEIIYNNIFNYLLNYYYV